MSSKSNVKQHIVAVILFISCTCFFCVIFFNKNSKKRILDLNKQYRDLATEKYFIMSQSPKDKYNLKKTEQEHKILKDKLYILKDQLRDENSKDSKTAPEKVLTIVSTAKKLNLNVRPGAIEEFKGRSIYTLEVYSNFGELYHFLKECYKTPGDISFNMLSIESHDSHVLAEIEFLL